MSSAVITASAATTRPAGPLKRRRPPRLVTAPDRRTWQWRLYQAHRAELLARCGNPGATEIELAEQGARLKVAIVELELHADRVGLSLDDRRLLLDQRKTYLRVLRHLKRTAAPAGPQKLTPADFVAYRDGTPEERERMKAALAAGGITR